MDLAQRGGRQRVRLDPGKAVGEGPQFGFHHRQDLPAVLWGDFIL